LLPKDEKGDVCLIVGLGNPGVAYAPTRHNLGARAVQSFAKAQGWAFRRLPEVKGKVACGFIEDCEVVLLLPLTSMNLSGAAVVRAMEAWGVDISSILVVSDDVALPMGEMRLKEKGSCGGHKGLWDIQERLQSVLYARLRLGIGAPKLSGVLADYVLSPFLREEEEILPEVLEKASQRIRLWIENHKKRV
jgi:peptidyl-tRNA hydrolase, PTH1 family